MSVKQISALVENKPGKVYELFKALADAKVNLRAMNIADTKDFGILRLIVEDTDQAKKVLSEYTIVADTDVIAVEMEDKAGELSGIIGTLSMAGINIEYLYAFVTPTRLGAYTVIRVDDVETAERALNTAGYTMLTQADINQM